MGLGGAATVGLAKARELAEAARSEVAAGRNPIGSREAARRSQAAVRTFGDMATEYFEAKSTGWKKAKVRKQWRTPLDRYAARIVSLPVHKLPTEEVLAVLNPIWATMPETVSRVRGRIEVVLDAARARGLIGANEANPACWRGHLQHGLPAPRRSLVRGKTNSLMSGIYRGVLMARGHVASDDGPARWHATVQVPTEGEGDRIERSGTSVRQRASAIAQRGWKGQPGGGARRLGSSPRTAALRVLRPAPLATILGTARIRACV